MRLTKTLLGGLIFITLALPHSRAYATEKPGATPAVDGVLQIRTKIPVTGVVVDKSGLPLIGATIKEKASGNGTITNIDGNFSMAVPQDATIEVSYIGYKTQEIPVNGTRTFTIVLEEDTGVLDEVVVVGYGIQRKVNLSGSVDQINAAELEKRPISNISRGLQGMIPNLNIDFVSGEPGQEAEINIRGEASINGGSPLILIDGVASDAAEMNRILPEDIESISVLKDASSAAIYGARAAFGVILITTKQGTEERVQVNYNNSFSWKKPTTLTEKTSDPYIYLKLKNIAVLNTPWSSGHVANDERLEWARQRSDNPNGTESIRLNPLDQTQWEYMGNTNWTKHFLDKNTFTQTHQVSISGATGKTRYYLSAGVENENGVLSHVVKDDYYQRYSMRSRVSYQVWDWFNISNNTSYVSTERKKPSYYNLNQLYDAEPHDVDLNTNGSWANTELGETLAQLVDGGQETTMYKRLQSTFSAEMNFWDKMLVLNANYTFMNGHEDYDWYKTKYQIGYGPDDIREQGTSRASKGSTADVYNVIDLFATFRKGFGKHFLSGVVGYNQEYYKTDKFTAERYDIISNSLPSIGLSSGEQYVGQEYKDWAIRGLFFRVNYTLSDRYIFEMNGRYDGTSRFSKAKRFGFFPSGSAAWRVDAEPFFEPARSIFSQLKLRGSYGSLGNQLVSEYGYMPIMESELGDYLVDGKLPQTVLSPGLVSPDYTWEKVYTINGGIDMGFFNNKLNVTFDIYQRDTKGMLTMGKELPGVLGKDEPNENAANLRTRGWELSVAYKDRFDVKGKTMEIGGRFILSDNLTTITEFDNPNRTLGQYYKGQKLGEIWGLQNDGFFRSQEEIAALDQSELIPWGALEIVEGWPKYKDLDGDKRITKGTTVDNPGDLSIIGNSTPRFRMGLNLNAQWNGIDVSAFFQGIGKRDYYPLSYLYWSFYQQPYTGGQLHAFDFYRPTTDSDVDMAKHSQSYINAGLANQNLNARFPVFQSWLADKNLGTDIDEAMGLAIPQTGYMLNGSYLRIKNITIGYTLPQNLSKRFRINRLRIYVSGDNLFEWSALKKFFDPEAITDGEQFGYVYPFNRQYTIGMNVTF